MSRETKETLADQLRTLGTGGVLVQMAERGQIIELRCEMPMCYCPKGRGCFDPKSMPLTDWAPTPDHYPQLKADGGHLVPWNVRLSHKLCNQQDFLWRMSIRGMLEKGMSLEEIAENLTHKGGTEAARKFQMVGQSGAKSFRLIGVHSRPGHETLEQGYPSATESCNAEAMDVVFVISH